MARYEVRDELDQPEGRGIDLDPNARQQPRRPAKQDPDFDELERGTFRNEQLVVVDNGAPRGDDDDQDDLETDEHDNLETDDDEDLEEDRPQRRRDEPVSHETRQDKDIRKRLARERRLREEAETDAEFYRERFEGVERRLNQVEAKVTGGETTAALKAEAEKLQAKQAKVKADLKTAKAAGDIDLEVELTEELGKIAGDLQVNAYKVGEAEKAAKIAAEKPVAGAEPNRHLAKWMRKHGAWFQDANNKALTAAIEKQVLATGSNPRTEDHFREVTKRLAKLHPKEFSMKEYGGSDTRRAKPPINGGNDNEGGTTQRRNVPTGIEIQVRNGKAYLTDRHYEVMRKFGMDPDDPNDVNDFVRQNVKRGR